MSYDIILGRDASDKKKFGSSGLIKIGKGYVTMGNYTSMSNNILLDVARSHVILVAGKRGCLEGNTLVFTDKGYKKIKEFNPLLDKILSFNPENQIFEWEKADLIRYHVRDEKLIKIKLENNKELIITKEHPLLITTGKKQLSLLWRNGENLKVGDLLLETVNSFKDINPIFIKEIKEIDNIEEVYDLSVPKNHSFIANGIISHNSGKSYTLGVITEEIANLPQETARNIAPIIFDTMGIFWTMKFKNEKDKDILNEWNLEAKESPVKVFAPIGKIEEYKEKGIPVDEPFALKASELEAEDWIITFNLLMTSQEGVLITNTISKLKQETDSFTIQDIIKQITHTHNVNQETKNVASSLFQAAESWGIFSKSNEGTEITDLVNAGKTTIIDLSVYSSIGSFNVRGLVIGLVSRKLFIQRINARKKEEIQSIQHGIDYMNYNPTRENPLIWLFVDECLTGDSEIITSTNHTQLQEVVNKFRKGEKIEVLTYDLEKKEFMHKKVKDIYEKGKRKIIKITTETGKELKGTPEHRVLTRNGFASLFSVDEIGTPLIQHYSQDKKCIEARLLGHLFGDGWASQKQQSLGFSGKINPNDLNKIKDDLSFLGLKSTNIYSRKTTSQITDNKNKRIIINGTSHSIQASYNAFKYFDKLGIIKGSKIIQPTNIPEWIKKSENKVKAEFLAALMGSDGMRITKAKNAKGDFNAIRLSFNKIEQLEKEAWEYAYEIKELFESLGVKTSSIAKRPGNIRKDGNKTLKIVITLEKNLENVIAFIEKIGYRYCSNKEIGGIKWAKYLKARLFLKKERENIWVKANELKKQGLGETKISQILNFPYPQIRDWASNRNKPGLPKTFLDFDEWTEKRIINNLLYEKVFRIKELEEEEVYDLSIDEVHNFVSNGFITHNCHEFLPKSYKTPATDALVQILREGRQPGISLVLATQQPGQIHNDVMTQSDIVISHRVTSKPDVEALNQIMQSYLLESIKSSMDKLPSSKGSAIILDDNSERIYPMRMRPRLTWHGGESPSAVKGQSSL
ncbi:MAG: DUF87 domain-containing protein [Nanoarchaeota archaeon]